MKKLLLLILMSLGIAHLQAQTSKVNVTIDGPGVVDEYLTTSADGKKQVKLKAIPSKFLENVTFDGWSGDATGKNTEITVSADKAQNIHAIFTYHRPVKKYPLIDLKKSWADMGKPMYYEMPMIWETQDMSLWRGTNYLPVDYNRDGYIDYVQFAKRGGMGIDNYREKVRFWLGQPDGSFIEDPLNDNKLTSTVYSIFMKYADFNDDGYPDFCSFSSGYDRQGATGDYPVVLMSGKDGKYTELAFKDYDHGYFHGGTTGDFDNDGDIDALFWDMNNKDGKNSLYLKNDGKGNFTKIEATELIDFSGFRSTLFENAILGYCDMEVTDLNNDGYNDLIMLMGDFPNDGANPGAQKYGYITPPIIFWGSSSGKFGGSNFTLLPPPRTGYGISSTFCFYDFNGDGRKEIIVEKCGDGQLGDTRFYLGGYLQVCEWDGDHYVDKTDKYIPVEHKEFNKRKSECRTAIETIDGKDYFIASEIDGFFRYGVGTPIYKLYVVENGILKSLEGDDWKTKISSYSEGLPIYVDGPKFTDIKSASDGVNPADTLHKWLAFDTDWDSTGGNMWRINLHHRDNTHFGRTSIKWDRDGMDPKKDKEQQTIGFKFNSEVDMSKLSADNYCLEFYIKNSDPNLTFEMLFAYYEDLRESEKYDDDLEWRSVSKIVSAETTVDGKFTGKWQQVLIPLSDFLGNSTFKDVKSFEIHVEGGDLNNVFYLDDIRIRRIGILSGTDYDRAFQRGYVGDEYIVRDRQSQITSLEFKSLLKPLVEKFAPDSIGYFNSRISDEDVPIVRSTAAMMAYYVARCIGATEINNRHHHSAEANFWEEAWGPEHGQVLPHAHDPLAESPDGWQESVCALLWNDDHVSPFSGRQVVAYVNSDECYAWSKPFTWDDAICAITRLYDSIDPEKMASGISVPMVYPASTQDVYYNLNGQRITNPSKGVYIKNGKKIIVK